MTQRNANGPEMPCSNNPAPAVAAAFLRQAEKTHGIWTASAFDVERMTAQARADCHARAAQGAVMYLSLDG